MTRWSGRYPPVRSNYEYVDWYMDNIDRGSATYHTISKLKRRPVSYGRFVKLIRNYAKNPHDYINKMRKKQLITVLDDKVGLTSKGRVLHAAASLGVRPLSFAILSFVYRDTEAVGIHVRNRDGYNCSVHSLLDEVQTQQTFDELSRKNLIERVKPDMYRIPAEATKKLSQYRKSLEKSFGLMLGYE